MAGVLVQRQVTALHRQPAAERAREAGRIVDRELVQQRVAVHPGEPLLQVQRAGRTQRQAGQGEAGRPVREAAGVDDQRVSLPPGARAAQPLADAAGRGRAAVERGHADVVVHLDQQRDGVRGLEDLHVVVVAARQQRRPCTEPEQAALGEAPLLGTGRAVAPDADADRLPVPGQPRLLARFRLRRQGRNPPVRRVDDQRRLRQRRRPRAVRPDGLAVAARVAGRRGEVAGQRRGVRLLRHRRGLLDAERRAAGELLRALQRRERPVVPHAAEVRIAPRRARRVRGLRRGGGRRQQGQRQDGRRPHPRSRHESVHRDPPLNRPITITRKRRRVRCRGCRGPPAA